MAVTIPSLVEVGPVAYDVSIDEVDLLRACRAERTDLLGHTNHRHLTILLDPNQAPGSMRDTLLHECLHAVLEQTGIAHEMEGDEEERLVYRLAPALLGLIRRNPELVTSLTEEC